MKEMQTLRDLDVDELLAAHDELYRRIAVYRMGGMAAGEAADRAAGSDEPIIEGETCAETALRFGIVAHGRDVSR